MPIRFPPGRRLHLIDLENLVGGSFATGADVRAAHACYLEAARPADGDHLVMATGPRLAPTAWFVTSPGIRRLIGRGRDGADRALLAAVPLALLIDRYDGVVVGSGDAAFTPLAAAVTRAGRGVTVVANRATVAASLRAAATTVITLRRDRVSPAGPGSAVAA